jgi:hypothetical protein
MAKVGEGRMFGADRIARILPEPILPKWVRSSLLRAALREKAPMMRNPNSCLNTFCAIIPVHERASRCRRSTLGALFLRRHLGTDPEALIRTDPKLLGLTETIRNR